MTSPSLRCVTEQRRIDSAVVVAVSGTVDALTAPQLAEAISTAAAGAPAAIVVDLLAVDFLSSSGMGVLAAAHAELTPAVRLVIVAGGPAVRRHLTLIGIADLMGVFDGLDAALAAVSD